MKLKNSSQSFGLIAQLLHWIMAIGLISLLSIGLYMTSLDYYNPWYHALPWWHKSLGLLMIFLLVFRWLWKAINPKVKPIDVLYWAKFDANLNSY